MHSDRLITDISQGIRKRVIDPLNRMGIVVPIAVFSVVILLLTAARIAPYDFRMSSLLGMQQEFIDLNPDAAFDGMVVFNESGYDGQFFYLVARSIFDPSMPTPILDTYRMRMGRIGMSLLVGLPAWLAGWDAYPLIAFFLLQLIHIVAFVALRSMLSEQNRYLALFFLFSPFSFNSSLLLVSDSLMVAVAVLSFYVLEKAGFRFSTDSVDRTNYRSGWIVAAALLLVYLVSIRDTALFAVAPIGLLYLYRRSLRGMLLAGLPVLCFLGWMVAVRLMETHPGAHPAHYTAKLGMPMQGFVESLDFSAMTSLKGAARELAKYLNLLYLLLLISTFYYITTPQQTATRLAAGILFTPLIFTATLSIISVVEYWATFDNVNRMFTLSIPIMVLLRDRIPGMRSHGLLLLSGVFFLLLAVRIVWLKPVMAFTTMTL